MAFEEPPHLLFVKVAVSHVYLQHDGREPSKKVKKVVTPCQTREVRVGWQAGCEVMMPYCESWPRDATLFLCDEYGIWHLRLPRRIHGDTSEDVVYLNGRRLRSADLHVHMDIPLEPEDRGSLRIDNDISVDFSVCVERPVFPYSDTLRTRPRRRPDPLYLTVFLGLIVLIYLLLHR